MTKGLVHYLDRLSTYLDLVPEYSDQLSDHLGQNMDFGRYPKNPIYIEKLELLLPALGQKNTNFLRIPENPGWDIHFLVGRYHAHRYEDEVNVHLKVMKEEVNTPKQYSLNVMLHNINNIWTPPEFHATVKFYHGSIPLLLAKSLDLSYKK